MKRAAEAGRSYWRVMALRVWCARQADILAIVVAKALPKRVRRWAAQLHQQEPST